MKLLNMQGPYESRRIKLAALRQGHQVVPEGWIDCLCEIRKSWFGIKMEQSRKIQDLEENSLEFFRNEHGTFIRIDHPEIGDISILGRVVFVTDIPA